MAEDRKARLAGLAARAGRNNNVQGDSTSETVEKNCESELIQTKTVNFRNYTPHDESLDNSIQEPATKRSKQNVEEGNTVQEEISELEKALADAKADEAMKIQDTGAVNITSVAPKKVNWDLKRDIAKKLNRLERRTQKSVVELLRQRLEKEAECQDDSNDLD